MLVSIRLIDARELDPAWKSTLMQSRSIRT